MHPYRNSGPETAAFDYARLRTLIGQYAAQGQNHRHHLERMGIPVCVAGCGRDTTGQAARASSRSTLPAAYRYPFGTTGTTTARTSKIRNIPAGWFVFRIFRANAPLRSQAGVFCRANISAACRLPFPDVCPSARRTTTCWRSPRTRTTSGWSTWTVGSAHTIVIPTPPGRYTATAHSGQTLPVRVADAKGLAVVLSDAPRILVLERAGH